MVYIREEKSEMEKECRDIEELHPRLREMARELVQRCEAARIPVKIGETYRTRNRQDDLFAQGRTRPGNIVTYARGSSMSSYHQWRLAFDVFINQKGKEYDKELLACVGKIGEEIGLEWGGAWRNFVDTPHFQYTGGLTIEDLKKGMRLVEDSRYSVKQVAMWVDDEMRQVEAIQVSGSHFVKLQDLRSSKIAIDYDTLKKCPILKLV